MWLVPLAEATAACGGKALGLARLIAAGLPVPEGWVLDDRAFRAVAGELPAPGGDRGGLGHALAEAAARIEAAELPPEMEAEISARAAELGRLAVRSSATIEDGEAGAAAGVFSSHVAVSPGEVVPALRAVWASALTPLAVGYARLRDGAAIAIAVILQRHVAGEHATVYTRPPGAPERDEIWIQRGDRLVKRARAEADPLIELALRAERAIGAARGADVELVIGGDPAERGGAELRDGERAWIVQARPVVHPVRRAQVPPPPVVLAPLVADGRRWTWDVAHNPDPLSVAQAELVERVERAGVAPWSMRVCAGYLYTAPREEVPRPAIASRAELEARVRELEARIEAALGDGDDGGGARSIEAAVERYLAFYAIWAREVGPLIAAARARAPDGSLRGARPSAIESALIAAARGDLDEAEVLARFGAMAPAWDVAAPTFGERPAVLRDAIARARLVIARGPAPPPPSPGDDLARAGADLAERDDLWFARAQQLVRRAVLRRAAALDLPPEDACWLPLDALGAAEDPPGPDPAGAAAEDRARWLEPSRSGDAVAEDRARWVIDARRRAAAARAAAARAAQWAMPFVVGSDAPAPGPPLRGTGVGGRATGRVRKVISLAGSVAVGRGEVVVTRAVTPALAVFVTGCAALVSETGGVLDHGASLARELGIACVVGCRDAWSLLADGMIVTVDGDAGTVVVDEG